MKKSAADVRRRIKDEARRIADRGQYRQLPELLKRP
jgi:hypothetical protein